MFFVNEPLDNWSINLLNLLNICEIFSITNSTITRGENKVPRALWSLLILKSGIQKSVALELCAIFGHLGDLSTDPTL